MADKYLRNVGAGTLVTFKTDQSMNKKITQLIINSKPTWDFMHSRANKLLARRERNNADFVWRLQENAKQPIGMYAQIELNDKVTVLYNVNDLKGTVINVVFHRLLKQMKTQTGSENHTLRVVKQFVVDRTLLSPIQCMQIERVIHSSVMVTVNSCNETEE